MLIFCYLFGCEKYVRASLFLISFLAANPNLTIGMGFKKGKCFLYLVAWGKLKNGKRFVRNGELNANFRFGKNKKRKSSIVYTTINT